MFASKLDGTGVGIPLKNFIYEGSNELWKQALKEPGSMVDWIIVRPGDKNDPVARSIDFNSPLFSSQFTRVVQESDGLTLFHRNKRAEKPFEKSYLVE